MGSRYGVMDASDCGGRLGPQIEGIFFTLENFYLDFEYEPTY